MLANPLPSHCAAAQSSQQRLRHHCTMTQSANDRIHPHCTAYQPQPLPLRPRCPPAQREQNRPRQVCAAAQCDRTRIRTSCTVRQNACAQALRYCKPASSPKKCRRHDCTRHHLRPPRNHTTHHLTAAESSRTTAKPTSFGASIRA